MTTNIELNIEALTAVELEDLIDSIRSIHNMSTETRPHPMTRQGAARRLERVSRQLHELANDIQKTL